MAGMRAASRGAVPSERAEPLLRACLDLVEHMSRQATEVTAAEVNTTLKVLDSAAAELEAGTVESNAVLTALRNAIGRMQALRTEILHPTENR
jgi:triphosphoribosyl-dephospho-CoA synthetase